MPKTALWQWYAERQTNRTNDDAEVHWHALKKTIYSGETKFQKVGVLETVRFGKVLVLDGDTQSSQLDEHIYHELLVHPALVAHPNPKRVVILGGGEGATLREILKHKTVEKAVMIDIDEEVVQLCEKYLPEWPQASYKDPRTDLIFTDARAYIEQAEDKFDVVISDLTEPLPDSPSHLLFSAEFFAQIKSKLNNPGLFVLQASTASIHNLYLHPIIYNTLKQVFKYVRSFSAYVSSFDTEWGFIVSSDSVDALELTKEEIDRRISQRLSKELCYYDGAIHQKIFILPKFLRKAIKEEKEFISDKKKEILDSAKVEVKV